MLVYFPFSCCSRIRLDVITCKKNRVENMVTSRKEFKLRGLSQVNFTFMIAINIQTELQHVPNYNFHVNIAHTKGKCVYYIKEEDTYVLKIDDLSDMIIYYISPYKFPIKSIEL